MSSAAAPRPGRNMGAPVPRIDARLKVTGQAPYAGDQAPKDMAHGVLVTGTIARGRVTRLHLEAARAVPGVLAVFAQGDMAGLERPAFGTSSASSIAPLHGSRIWHDGQILALVVADSLEAAGEAAAKVKADYAAETPAWGFDSPAAETVPAEDEEEIRVGDMEAAFAAAPVSIERHYGTPVQHHNPIELFSTTCVWTGEELTVFEPSQNVNGFRHELARQLRIDPARVRVIARYVGGGFGSKGPMTARTAIVAEAARRIGRPVRCVVTRMQGFTTVTYRAETRHRVRLAAGRDGRIAAYGHDSAEVTSRADDYSVGGSATTARLYGHGSILTRVSLVRADRNTPGYMRSPPELPYMYALESALDELAAELGMDPVELRRVNDTMVEPVRGTRFTSRGLMDCFDAAAGAFGWRDRDPAPGRMRDGDWLVGYGCAATCYPTNVGAAAVRLRLSRDGSVSLQISSQEIGTGIRTVAAQMAAERLGVELARVTVEMGDTALPPAPVSGGSNSTASVCSGTIAACDALRARLFRAAAGNGPLAGRDPAAMRLEGDRVLADGAAVGLGALFDRLGVEAVEETANWRPDGTPEDAIEQLYDGGSPMRGGKSGDKARFAFGAEFVEVRVHARTREIRVPRAVGAFAAGRIMNPRTARSQLMGGILWGISSALLEATEIDPHTARYVNRDLAEYLVPVCADAGAIEVLLLPEEDPDVNPAGVKGLGELGNVGTAAAVANAVYHATGRRVRDLPIRIEDLL